MSKDYHFPNTTAGYVPSYAYGDSSKVDFIEGIQGMNYQYGIVYGWVKWGYGPEAVTITRLEYQLMQDRIAALEAENEALKVGK